MAIIKVQSITGSTAGQNPTQAYGSNNATGNLLIAAIGVMDTLVTISSVTDSAGNTWSLADRILDSNSNLYIYFAVNSIVGANTVTVHLSGVPGGNGQRTSLYEYSGLLTVSPLDVHTTLAGAAVASIMTIGPLTATVPGSLGFVTFKNKSANITEAPFGGGYTDIEEATVMSSGHNLSVTGSTTATATANGTPTDSYLAVLALFKPAVPPPNITSLSITSGAVGAAVTITGTNFGSTQGGSTVTFNGTLATVTSWSDTSLSTTVPVGATTGNVVVTVGGQSSNGVNFTVTAASGAYSVPDSRAVTATTPNTSRNVQGTLIYDVQKVDSRVAPNIPIDCRIAPNIPIDSRVAPNIPLNSRTPGTYGPGVN